MKFICSLLLLFSLISPSLAREEDKESFFEKMASYIEFIDSMVKGSLDSRGLTMDTLFEPNLSSWESVAKDIDQHLLLGRCQNVKCKDYESDFAIVTDSKLAYSEEIKIIENKESFELRKDLINNAKESIHVLVWAIYDDETGAEFRNLLLDALKRNPEMDIRVIVDGNIANTKGRKILKSIDKASEGKIKIMKWKSVKYRANGNHRKILVVDKEHVIVGGMNIGNNYSHMGDDPEWRDLDVYIYGRKTGRVAYNQFVDVWNKQLTSQKKIEKYGRMQDYPQFPDVTGKPVVLVDQHPGSESKKAYHNVHTAVVKLLRDAQSEVIIENAYFIMDPIIRAEIEKVLKRGVKVKIYTNSDKSVDEKIVSMPVMHSARDVMMMGAEVYLRQGTTLHAKYMIIDSKVTMIGSFNLHPRSLRFDAENVAVIFDQEYSEDMRAHFYEGIREAIKYEREDQFVIDWNFIGLITSKFYFDFL